MLKTDRIEILNLKIHSHPRLPDPMTDLDENTSVSEPSAASAESQNSEAAQPKSLKKLQRRILGVLIEKARTTPDSYPLSLNGLVTGCNQKSNRSPLMNVSAEQVDDELIEMRESGMVAEVQGGGRVPKYRHYAKDFLGVTGIETGVIAELLLRGEQSVGDLRSRASRFGPIADVNELLGVLKGLEERGLVVALSPPGRGQMFTHNLYAQGELEVIQRNVASGVIAPSSSGSSSSSRPAAPVANPEELNALKTEVAELRALVEKLGDRLDRLES